MVIISQLMTYWSSSWIVSYSRNCYDSSCYEHMLQEMSTPSPRQPAWWGEHSPRHRQLLHPSEYAGQPYVCPHNTARHMPLWIQDLELEDIAERMRIKKKQADKRRMRRIRWAAEIQTSKVKQLKRELQIAHKKSRTEDGELGIARWNREYWGTGFGVKRLGIKKEEPSTPFLQIKVEPPPTPPLTYPPSRTSSSIFRDIDLNDFVWSTCHPLFNKKSPLHIFSNSGIWHLLV